MSDLNDTNCQQAGDSPGGGRAVVNCTMVIYFISGACSLIDEVVWVRLLKLTLGNTVYATSIVVSVFMGGLALGALIMGRYSDNIVNRLRLYALLETLVTVSALSLPWLLKLADAFYVWFYRAYHPGHLQLLIIQVIVSAALLLAPSMLMGSTLPLLGRFVTSLEKEAGHLVGKLYALNTLGAATGCFLAGFVLIRAVGVMGSLYVAAGLNLLVAFGGWVLSRFSKITQESQPEPARIKSSEPAVDKKFGFRFYLLIVAFFMSGLVSIGYELLWMRSIVHLLGGFTYVFSAVLTIYLVGNVIGAGIGSKLAKTLKAPAVCFAMTLLLLGLCGLFYLPVLVLWTAKGLPHLNKALDVICSWLSVSPLVVNPLVQSFILFLVPAVVMGIGFPIALQAWANHVHKVGRSTGTAYGANTIGAVLGGLVTGFVLIPFMGVQLGISILGLAAVWIAAIMGLLFVRGAILKRCALMVAIVILTIFVAKAPADLFDVIVRINPVTPYPELLWVREGVTTTVSLHRDEGGALALASSGQGIAGESFAERGDQKALGNFGVLLNSNAKKVLSVGFGSGETTACLARYDLDRIDCVEIAPEVVEVSLKFFSHLNLGDRLNEEINMIFMDAKNYIHLTDEKYDVIVNDSIHPRSFAENASLYAKEYFQSAKEHLNDNGIIISWLPTYQMPPSVFSSIIGTVLEVFPHVTIWYLTPNPAPLILIAASQQQQFYSPEYMVRCLRKEGVGAGLAEIYMNNNIDILSCYVADERDLQKVVKAFSVNSDYSPFIEFCTDTSIPKKQIFQQFVMSVRSDSLYDHIDWTGFSRAERQQWIQDYKQLYAASTHQLLARNSPNALDQLKHSLAGLEILPDNPALRETKNELEKKLLYTCSIMATSGRADNALAVADQILQIDPASATAWIIRSLVMRFSGDMPQALANAKHAARLAPQSPEVRLNLGYILFNMGKLKQSLSEYRKILELSPDMPEALIACARILVAVKNADFYNPTEAVSSAERACELTGYKKVEMLVVLSTAYAAAGRIGEAIDTIQKAIERAQTNGQKEAAQNLQNRLLLLKSTPAPK